jgi:hypothetical protein
MNHMSGICLVSMVVYVVAGGSAALGHGHGSTHPAASHPPAAHHSAPKSGAKPNAEKHSAGKPKEPHHDEKKPKGVASAAKPHDKSHEHHDEHHHDEHRHDEHHHDDHHHHDAHHHEHGDHEWVGGTVIENGAAVDGAPGAAVTGNDGVPAAAVVPDVAPTGSAGRPQIQFSVDPAERDSYEAAAQAAGMSRSEWIRTRLNAAAGRELK